MSNAINKVQVQAAMQNAAQAKGQDTLREFDKVWAAINRGEFDIEEPKAEDSLAGELDAIKALSANTQRFVDSAHGPGEYLVTDWALAISVRYLQGEQEAWAAGLPEMVTYATEPSGSIVAEIGALQVIHERLMRIAANGNHLAKSE